MSSQDKEIQRTCVGTLSPKPVSCPEKQKIHSGQKGMVKHGHQQGQLVWKKDSTFPVNGNKQDTLNLDPEAQKHNGVDNQHLHLRPWKIPGAPLQAASKYYYLGNIREPDPGLTAPLFPNWIF